MKLRIDLVVMNEELKNKIRVERIRETVNDKIVRLFNKNNAYYKPMTIEKIKDFAKDDIIELRKKDCKIYLKLLYPYIKDIDAVIEKFKEMDINEVLLLTYRYNLLYNIILYESSGDILNQTELTLDDLEKKVVYLAEKKHEDDFRSAMERTKVIHKGMKKKAWWNIF